MFRFTIRDVLWLMVVVALVVGWSTQHFRLLHERASLNAERELVKAHRKKLDLLFLQLVEAQDRLNDQQAREQRAKVEH